MEKDYALTIVNNIKELLLETHYFKNEVNMVRDLDRLRDGIKNGFN